MPIKSKAQRRKFAELLVKGEISPEVYERWNREAGRADLPERVHPKAKPKRRKATPKRGRKAKTPRRRTAKVKVKVKAKALAKRKAPTAKKRVRTARKRG